MSSHLEPAVHLPCACPVQAERVPLITGQQLEAKEEQGQEEWVEQGAEAVPGGVQGSRLAMLGGWLTRTRKRSPSPAPPFPVPPLPSPNTSSLSSPPTALPHYPPPPEPPARPPRVAWKTVYSECHVPGNGKVNNGSRAMNNTGTREHTSSGKSSVLVVGQDLGQGLGVAAAGTSAEAQNGPKQAGTAGSCSHVHTSCIVGQQPCCKPYHCLELVGKFRCGLQKPS